jgi:hypothetical protein
MYIVMALYRVNQAMLAFRECMANETPEFTSTLYFTHVASHHHSNLVTYVIDLISNVTF